MANLNGTQKKQRNAFIAMLVAIVLVVAAIAYVLFGGLTAKSSLLYNQDFATALSETLGKAPAFITEEDLADIKYVSVQYSAQDELALLGIGGDDFITTYNDYIAKLDAGEDVSSFDFTDKVKSAVFELNDENTKLDDIKFFTGAEIVEISGITFTDSSVFAGMKKLTTLIAEACGLSEVSGLTGLEAEKVKKIDLYGNNVADWSPLEYIKDKAIVNYTIELSEDGQSYSFVEQTLAEYNEAKAAAEEASKENEASEEVETPAE